MVAQLRSFRQNEEKWQLQLPVLNHVLCGGQGKKTRRPTLLKASFAEIICASLEGAQTIIPEKAIF